MNAADLVAMTMSHAQRRVAFYGGKRVAHLRVHRRRKAVEAIGSVQRDSPDTVRRLEFDALVSHSAALPLQPLDP